MARISDLLAAGQTFSFEFFPPQTDDEQRRLAQTLYDLQALKPSFVSVTYRGGPSSRQRTHDLVVGMLKTTTLTPMAHLICAGHSRLELADILVQLAKGGVENLMALGGDVATDEDAVGEMRYAHELVGLANAIGGFCVGVAAHPAVHPRSPSREEDRDRLAEKLADASFAITQSIFDVESYRGLVDDLAARGVTAPVIPGIMPILSPRSIAKQDEIGAAIPLPLRSRLEAYADDPETLRATGIEVASELCRDLLAAGAPGLHFYTLNRSKATREIYTNLGLDRAA